jgi:hypothetical protein
VLDWHHPPIFEARRTGPLPYLQDLGQLPRSPRPSGKPGCRPGFPISFAAQARSAVPAFPACFKKPGLPFPNPTLPEAPDCQARTSSFKPRVFGTAVPESPAPSDHC